MIYHYDVEQGSDAWIKLRLGVVTASEFHRIITPKTRKRSASAPAYLAEKVAEWLLGKPCDATSSEWMKRGSELEAQARHWYEFDSELSTTKVGFVSTDDGLVGCSPDSLVGDKGGNDIKIFSAANHMDMVLGADPGKEVLQMQGCMWLCDREWWDIVYWNPVLPSKCLRLERDDAYIADIVEAVGSFVGDMETERDRLRSMGFAPAGESTEAFEPTAEAVPAKEMPAAKPDDTDWELICRCVENMETPEQLRAMGEALKSERHPT